MTMSRFFLLLLVFLGAACTHRNSPEETAQYRDQFTADPFPHTGTYHWTFQLMGSPQESIHTFYADSIGYRMTGQVYATDYTMQRLSYDQQAAKWIGEDGEGVVYVLFFKEKTDSSLTIYKHKCKSGGLAEALAFARPRADETADHGWNVYSREGYTREDQLPLVGNFSNAHRRLQLSDSLVRLGERQYEKMSFHAGERRWVGQDAGEYLQVFFERLDPPDSLRVAVQTSADLMALYQTKYQAIENWERYGRD